MNSLPPIQLSQAHLQILETCPRKFQYFFLDSLMMPQPSNVLEKQELGSQFHQLMQQRALGLEIQPLLNNHPKLQEWFGRFQDAPPPLISGLHQNEYPCTLMLENFTLTAVFDLLIQGTDEAQVVDWKTYRRPHRSQLLEQHWQTKLYLFLVSEVLGYAPDRVSMLYWFAESSPKPSTSEGAQSCLSIPYSASMHHQTRTTLDRLLTSLDEWMKDFTVGHQDFPKVPLTAQKCSSSQYSCPFLNYCYPGLDRAPTSLESLMDLGAIAEIPFN
jgi:PD-(D/E)XK nuclease superfamily